MEGSTKENSSLCLRYKAPVFLVKQEQIWTWFCPMPFRLYFDQVFFFLSVFFLMLFFLSPHFKRGETEVGGIIEGLLVVVCVNFPAADPVNTLVLVGVSAVDHFAVAAFFFLVLI